MNNVAVQTFFLIQASPDNKTDPPKTGNGGDPEGEGAGGAGGEDGEEGAQEALHEVDKIIYTHMRLRCLPVFLL